MSQHWRYLSYVLRHKWFVFLACCRLGIPVAGIIHDLSKLRRDEWVPYANSFYGPKYPKILDIHGDLRNDALASGHYKEKVRGDFDLAWLKHQHRNPHHWQHWVLREDDGNTKLLPIPDRYRREMLADWRGAGRAMGKGDDVRDWYLAKGPTMLLHAETRVWIEDQLHIAQVGTV